MVSNNTVYGKETLLSQYDIFWRRISPTPNKSFRILAHHKQHFYSKQFVERSHFRNNPRQCVKSVQIRSFFYSVFSRIRTEYGPEKTRYLDTFHTVRASV